MEGTTRTSPPGTVDHTESETPASLGVSARAGRPAQSGGPCPLCEYEAWAYLFVSHGVPVYRCAKCGLTRLYPQPTRAEVRSEEHTSELQSQFHLVCRLLLEKKKKKKPSNKSTRQQKNAKNEKK